jgi:NAD-dependent SIR2 family protein deacetylase
MTLKVKVRCITCKATKDIDEAEAARLTEQRSIPMCDACYMPMVAVSASR